MVRHEFEKKKLSEVQQTLMKFINPGRQFFAVLKAAFQSKISLIEIIKFESRYRLAGLNEIYFFYSLAKTLTYVDKIRIGCLHV